MEEMIQSLKEDTASKDDLIKQLQSDLARHALGVETGKTRSWQHLQSHSHM